MRSGRNDEAAELFTKVIDAGCEPDLLSTALTNRGLVQCRRKLAKGDRGLSRSIRLQPKLATAHSQPGMAARCLSCRYTPQRARSRRHATSGCNATGVQPELPGDVRRRMCGGRRWPGHALAKARIADPAYRQKYGEATVSGRMRLYEQGFPRAVYRSKEADVRT